MLPPGFEPGSAPFSIALEYKAMVTKIACPREDRGYCLNRAKPQQFL